MPRTEDTIRRLCLELLSKSDDAEVGPLLAELREALRQHIESLRKRFGGYPILVERRSREHIPPLDEQGQEKR